MSLKKRFFHQTQFLRGNSSRKKIRLIAQLENPCTGKKKSVTRKALCSQEINDIFLNNNSENCQSEFIGQKISSSVCWVTQRKKLIEDYISSQVYSNEICMVCEEGEGNCKCDDCGIFSICEKCVRVIHKNVRLHCPKRWNNHVYEEFNVDSLCTFQSHHTKQCHTAFEEILPIVDCQGRLHPRCHIKFCSCHTMLAVLHSLNLWPNKPEDPTFLFDFTFLRLGEIMQLEGKMSCYAFCSSMSWMNKDTWNPQINVYRHLTNYESFEEFKFLQQTKLTLGDLPNDFICPSCFENPHRTYIIDGNFAAVHKKSASKINTDMRYQSSIFTDVDSPDFHFESSNESCSNFRAGDYIHSKECLKKLDVQGIFAAVCRHEFWKVLIDMNSGERFSYPVTAIKKILSDLPSDCSVNVVYDVACKLEEYISRRNDLLPLLRRVTLSIDQFHAYGHNSVCQIFKTVRCMKNVGLTSGSQMERQWPIIRKTAPQTKEMSLNHRRDFIVSLLLHEHFKRRFNLAKTFSKWKSHAEVALRENEEKLENLKREHEATDVNQRIIDQWLKNEKSAQKEKESCTDRNSILRQLQNLAVARQFTLQMIKRYPMGQKINIRLNKELKRQEKKRRKLVDNIRDCGVKVDYKFFLNPESSIFLDIDDSLEGLSRTYRLQIIHAWRLVQRAKEELRLIDIDCDCAVKFFSSLRDQILYEGDNDPNLKAFYFRRLMSYDALISDLKLLKLTAIDLEDDADSESCYDSDDTESEFDE